MHSVGFEPTLPKKLRPERSALDHSAKSALLLFFIKIKKNKKYTYCGDRTHDHWLKRPTLYRLS